MAIQRVSKFEATADVLGSIRRVRLDETGLWIESPCAEDALAMLRRLSLGELSQLDTAPAADGGTKFVVEVVKFPSSGAQPQKPGPDAELAKAAAVAAAKSKPAPAPAPAPAPVSEPAEPPKPKPAAKRGAKPQTAQSELTELPPATPPGPDPLEEIAPAAAPAAAPAPEPAAAPADGVPPELVDAKKLRDVVSWFIDHGVKSPDAIVAKCLELQPQIKILSRISNVEERVRRAIEVLGVEP